MEMTSTTRHRIASAIELSLVRGIGARARRRLAEEPPGRWLQSSPARLRALGLAEEAVSDVVSRRWRAEAEAILGASEHGEFYVLIIGCEQYPKALLQIPDPPLVLYARGRTSALERPVIAIVGTRRPSLYGLHVAEGLGADLGSREIAVASGLARGIDAAAHRGCLRAGGMTVAVLGSGIDVIYPREHQRLAEEVAGAGLLLSEFPPGTPPAPRNFPVRNRIISGLALGTVVVEAREASGSLVTARLALEQDREVFAVPGNVTALESMGPNFLIKQGAKLVQSWRDVVEELPEEARRRIRDCHAIAAPERAGRISLPEPQCRVLAALAVDRAVHFDELVATCRADVARLGTLLLELELGGFIRQLPGNLYVKSARGGA
jgi:DNA processing protein